MRFLIEIVSLLIAAAIGAAVSLVVLAAILLGLPGPAGVLRSMGGTVLWTAFVIAGLFAGLAGALFAFSKGGVAPDALSVTKSVDALVMVLLGGVQTLAGPLVGAVSLELLGGRPWRDAGTPHRETLVRRRWPGK